MTLAGKEAVRQAFQTNSGLDWPAMRDDFVSTRVNGLYDPFNVRDLQAGGIALELVHRAYLQGLREAQKLDGKGQQAALEKSHRATEYTHTLMTMFSKQIDPDWVSEQERQYVQDRIQVAFCAGCDEGRLTIGSVI